MNSYHSIFLLQQEASALWNTVVINNNGTLLNSFLLGGCKVVRRVAAQEKYLLEVHNICDSSSKWVRSHMTWGHNMHVSRWGSVVSLDITSLIVLLKWWNIVNVGKAMWFLSISQEKYLLKVASHVRLAASKPGFGTFCQCQENKILHSEHQ
jgi:hypothetical protein